MGISLIAKQLVGYQLGSANQSQIHTNQGEINMRSAMKIINLPLVSITDGKLVGEIKDFYFDTQEAQLVAVVVGQKGLISPKSLIVKREAIQVFGQDVWLLHQAEVVEELSKQAGETRYQFMHDISGREITTSGETKVGTVGDVWLDDEARVAGFGLDKVFMKGPIAEKKYIPLQAVQDWGVRAMGMGGHDNPMVVDLSVIESTLQPEQGSE
jgi:uncharacterized protein YrrD